MAGDAISPELRAAITAKYHGRVMTAEVFTTEVYDMAGGTLRERKVVLIVNTMEYSRRVTAESEAGIVRELSKR